MLDVDEEAEEEEEEELEVEAMLGGGGLVVVFTPGAVYADIEVAVQGGGVMRDKTTLPLGSVEAISFEGRTVDADIPDVMDAELVREESVPLDPIDVGEEPDDVTAVEAPVEEAAEEEEAAETRQLMAFNATSKVKESLVVEGVPA